MSIIPPVNISELYNDLDFLALAGPNQKPCFKNKTYSSIGWGGYLYRRYYQESQKNYGNFRIMETCQKAIQIYDAYRDVEPYGRQLVQKICRARQGLI